MARPLAWWRTLEPDWAGRVSAGAGLNTGEIAGATFSPSAEWLFLNLQNTGRTLAITGPW